MLDEITYLFPFFNDTAVQVWVWISNFTPNVTEHAITYPYWDWSYIISVKGAPGSRNTYARPSQQVYSKFPSYKNVLISVFKLPNVFYFEVIQDIFHIRNVLMPLLNVFQQVFHNPIMFVWLLFDIVWSFIHTTEADIIQWPSWCDICLIRVN